MEIKKSNNKSLIMYTSLIFIAAIIMIVVSFFAQKHLEQLKVSETEAENVTLSNKAAQISEENLQLVELNKTLKDSNAKLISDNQVLTQERDNRIKEVDSYKALIEVYDKLLDGKEKAANELIETIVVENLTPEQVEIYNSLVKELK